MSETPTIEAIRPSIYRVPVPLPNSPLRFLNSYFILSDDKTTIVDVGFNHPDCARTLEDALHRLGRDWDSVEILLTHSHPDHTGCLDRIWERGMQVYANMHSFQEVRNLMNMESTVFNPLIRSIVSPTEHPFEEASERDASKYRVSAELLPMKNRFDLHYLGDGDVYRNGSYTFQVITTPGHDDWHICLYEPHIKMLIAGDTVLERITPAVYSWLVSYNALNEFLGSLDKLYNFDVDIVLPGHGEPFTGMRERIDFLKVHHTARLEEICGLVLAGHTTILDIARQCAWKHADWDSWPLDQKFYSLGETMAHLIYLVNEGRVRYSVCGADIRFEPLCN
jgi:glyoxylase-like metal-dependent hydrolase (beta-lactamase superfamily II)